MTTEQKISDLKDELRVNVETVLNLMRELNKLNGHDHWLYEDRRNGDSVRIEYRK